MLIQPFSSFSVNSGCLCSPQFQRIIVTHFTKFEQMLSIQIYAIYHSKTNLFDFIKVWYIYFELSVINLLNFIDYQMPTPIHVSDTVALILFLGAGCGTVFVLEVGRPGGVSVIRW